MVTKTAEEPTVMLAWNLESSSDDGTSRERVIDHDKRTRVKSEDLHVHGKYRRKFNSRLLPTTSAKPPQAIVKLWMQFGDVRYAGTGWLVSECVVATAAHNVYDHAYRQQGRVGHVKASVAYCGKDAQSTDAPDVQFRSGTKVLVPSSWYWIRECLHDFAFIELESPFEDVEPLAYQPTPCIGSEYLGVVGYPGDKCYEDEPGAEMYEEFRPVKWDIRKTRGYLTYPVSTGHGNSGSPVVMRNGDKYVAIATHIQGYEDKNLASPIGTDPFNSYHAIIERFFKGPWPEPCGFKEGMEVHAPPASASYLNHGDPLSILAGIASERPRELFAGLGFHESIPKSAETTLASWIRNAFCRRRRGGLKRGGR